MHQRDSRKDAGEDSAPQPIEPTTPQVVKWLLGITQPVHKPLFLSLLFRILNLTLDLALFGIVAAGAVNLALGGPGGRTYFIWITVLALSKATAFYLEQFTGHYVAFKALELLRTHVFARLWPKAPAIVSQSKSGDILASLTRDIDRIEVVYAHTFAPVVSAYIVGPAAVLVSWAWFGPLVAAGMGVPLLVSLFVVPFMGVSSSFRSTRIVLKERRELSHQVSDSVFGLNTVLGYGLESERLQEMEDLGEKIAKSSAVARDWTGVRRGANVTLSLLAVLLVVVAAAPTVALPLAAGLAAATLRLFEGPRGVEDSASYLDHSLAAARRLHEVSEAPAAVEDGPEQLALDANPSVSFKNITYRYPGFGADTDLERRVLDEVSFSVPAGGHGILVGRSGSGKSTLVQLLVRYDDPVSGDVLVGSQPVDQFTLDSLRKSIVIVTQKEQLLNASLADNLRLGAPEATDADLWEALTVAAVADEVAAMPEGLETQVGVAGSSLSGGQMQRVCLARALLLKPKVLVLDEFAASLNVELEEEIRRLLQHFYPGLTILEVTHRLQAAQHGDIVGVLDQGRIVAAGTPEEVAERLQGTVRAG